MGGLDSLPISVPFLEEPVVELPRDGLPLVVQVIDVSRAGMRNAHYGPQGLGPAFSLVGLILRIAHLFRIIVENLLVV